MLAEFEKQVSQTLDEIKSQGLFKTERIITSPQDAHIEVAGGKRVLNMCANNYLGLADHPALLKAAKEALAELKLQSPEVGQSARLGLGQSRWQQRRGQQPPQQSAQQQNPQ